MATDHDKKRRLRIVPYNHFDLFAYIKKKYATVTDWNSQPLKLLHNILIAGC